MFEILLSLCLADDAAICRTERISGGETYEACRAKAERLVRESVDTPQAWPCVPAGERDPFPLTEIADGVFVHKGAQQEANPENRGDIANLGFILGRDAVAAIDAGGSPALAREFLAAIRRRTALPVKWLILTHMHPDHSLGAGVFAEAGATVIGHRRLKRALASRIERYLAANRELIGPAFGDGPPLTDIEPAPDVIDLGGRVLDLEAHATAHTDNDLSVYDRKTGIRFLGDLLFVDHLPVVDGSVLGWRAAMDDLQSRRSAGVAPGHGPVRVDWPDSSTEEIDYLTELIDITRKKIAAGESMLEATESIPKELGAGWLLVNRFQKRNLTAAYKELEWE